MSKRIRTRVSCVQCPKCKDIIYSRAHYDFHSCTCKEITIDGGFDYMHVGWKSGKSPDTIIKYVNATRSDLYNDWNYMKDQYGIIKVVKK